MIVFSSRVTRSRVQSLELSVDAVNYSSVIDVSCSSDNQVLSSVVPVDELSNLLRGDVSNVVSVTKGGLSHLVVSEAGVESVLEGALHHVLLKVNNSSIYAFSFGFELVLVEGRVSKNVADALDSLVDVVLVASNIHRVSLSADFLGDLGSDRVEGLLELTSARFLSSSQSQVLDEGSDAGSVLSFVS